METCYGWHMHVVGILAPYTSIYIMIDVVPNKWSYIKSPLLSLHKDQSYLELLSAAMDILITTAP